MKKLTLFASLVIALFITACTSPTGSSDSSPTTYIVTFNSNGGSTVASQSVTSGSTATKPTDPTKTGYAFAGWTLNGTAYSFSAPVTASITLTASWTANAYTVTFNSNGGSALAPQTVNYGSTATQPAAPTKSGYTFGGWTLNGAAYSFSTPVTGNVTLTASWTTLPVYTVTFNSNGGSAVASESVVSGSTATQPTSPTQAGYTFSGWTLNGSAYSFSTAVTANVTLVASWTALPVYTITFNSNGGSSVASQSVTSGSTATQPTSPTLANYTFNGWTLNGSAYSFSTPVTANVTLTASWTSITYVVTFNSNGGSSVASQTVVSGSTATQPTPLTNSPHVFKGWYSGSTAYNFSTPVTSNLTLTASWTSTVVVPDTVEYDSSITYSFYIIGGKLVLDMNALTFSNIETSYSVQGIAEALVPYYNNGTFTMTSSSISLNITSADSSDAPTSIGTTAIYTINGSTWTFSSGTINGIAGFGNPAGWSKSTTVTEIVLTSHSVEK
jgi:uncharacterized repeat protein (TIGR02543 family)